MDLSNRLLHSDTWLEIGSQLTPIQKSRNSELLQNFSEIGLEIVLEKHKKFPVPNCNGVQADDFFLNKLSTTRSGSF